MFCNALRCLIDINERCFEFFLAKINLKSTEIRNQSFSVEVGRVLFRAVLMLTPSPVVLSNNVFCLYLR